MRSVVGSLPWKVPGSEQSATGTSEFRHSGMRDPVENGNVIEIGRALEVHEEPQRLNVPVVGTHAASAVLVLLMGSICLILGGGISLIGMEWISIDKDRVHVPMRILTLVGLVFAIPGMMLLFAGIKRVLARPRFRELRSRHPDQAWAWDGNWDGRVLLDRNLAHLWTRIIGIPFLVCFAGVFHYVGVVDERAPRLFLYASILVDLGLLIAGILVARSLLRLLKHGRGRIGLSDMPIRPGRLYTLQLTVGSDLSLFDRLHLDLAYVEERLVETGSGKNRNRHLIAETRLRETIDIEFAGLTHGMQSNLSFDIRIPESAPETQLSSQPSKSWQLGIRLETSGLDYKGRFLLPVYRVGAADPAQPLSTSVAPELTTIA